jgi:hypothetical protein
MSIPAVRLRLGHLPGSGPAIPFKEGLAELLRHNVEVLTYKNITTFQLKEGLWVMGDG